MPRSNPPYQTKVNQTANTTIILSPHHLLAYHLSSYLAQKDLDVTWYHLPPSKPTFPSPDPAVKQETLTTTPTQAPWQSVDYCFFIFPFSTQLNLTRLLPLLASTTSKLNLTLRFASQTKISSQVAPLISSSDYRINLVDHLFGPYQLTTDSGFTEKIFAHLWQKKPLKLPATTQTKLFPTYAKNAVKGIIQATFTPQTNQQTFALSPLEATTLTDFALQLEDPAQEYHKFNPDLDLSQQSKQLPHPNQDLIAHTQATLDWQPQSDLKVPLQQTFKFFNQYTPQPPPAPVSEDQSTHQPDSLDKPPTFSPGKKPAPQLTPLQKQQKQTKKTTILSHKLKKLSSALFKSLLLTLIIFLPLIIFLTFSFQGLTRLRTSLDQLQAGEYQASLTSADKAQNKLQTSRRLVSLATRALPFNLAQNKLQKYDHYFDIGIRFSQIIHSTTQASQTAQDLYLTIIDPTSTNFSQLNSSLSTQLNYLYNQLSLLQTSLDQLDIRSRLKFIHQLNDLKNKIPDLRQRVKMGIAILDILPQAINTSTPQTYALLVQNNQEIRPTGGFIDTLSLLTFKQGHLIDHKTLSSYQADAKLVGETAPPPPLKQYLGEQNWYLRDSNWHPDFPSAAKQADWFIQKELNTKLSGLIGLNLITLQNIHTALGSLNIANLDSPLTPQNLTHQVYQHTPVDQDPPSLITPLTKKILRNITTNQLEFTTLIKAINQSLQQAELTIFLNDPQLQSVIETNNWSGSLINKGCPQLFTQNYCTSQTFAVIEANLGINQSNYHLSRRLNHQVTIQDQGQINHQINLNYQNNPTTSSTTRSTYKTYTRFYLPPNIQLISSHLNKQPLTPQNITLDPYLGLKVIAFYYTVPPGQNSLLNLQLQSQQIVNTLSPTSSLSINWQKQSGTGSLPATVTIKHPPQLKAQKITLPAATQPQSLIFNQPINSDTTFAVQFTRQ